MDARTLIAMWSLAGFGACATRTAPPEPAAVWPARTHYQYVEVAGHRIFYREAGDPARPTLLLLHGFPSSSHTYRELIPLLSGRYHVVAPDYLGSGYSDHPKDVAYTFDLLAAHVTGFVETLGLSRYVLYLQDFGAPVGFRVAMAHPERVAGLVLQNANAYIEGLSPVRREFFRRAHDDHSPEELAALLSWVGAEAIRDKQYLRDVPGERAAFMSPDAWTNDLAMLATDDDRRIQVQLFQDYQTNIDAYPTWQRYLREQQPPTLVLWGERDPAFLVDAAHAVLRDVPAAELHLLDAGHFAVEERPVEVAQWVVGFMERIDGAP